MPTSIRSMRRSNNVTIRACGASRSPSAAGVVLAASYEAKRFGVRSAMSGWQARRLCPNLIDVPARFDAYVEASKAVYAIFHDTSPLVGGHVDRRGVHRRGRAAGGSPARPREIAQRLRERVADEVGLPITVGVARTKFLAKVASGSANPTGCSSSSRMANSIPPPAAGPTPLGCRCDHRGEAQRTRRAHRRRRRRDVGGGAHRDRRPGRRAPPARAGPQP